MRTCTRSEFFMPEFMNICDDFQILVTRMRSTFYALSKLKYGNFNPFFHSVILLSDNRSLNPEPNHQHNLQCLNEWDIFKTRGLHFIHLIIDSFVAENQGFSNHS